MKALSLSNLENLKGGEFLDGFCATASVIAIATGGTIPVANIAAAGCFLWYLSK